MTKPYGYIVTYGFEWGHSHLTLRTMKARSLWDAYLLFQTKGSRNYSMIHSFPVNKKQYDLVKGSAPFYP